ncbi:MAG: hypothetical protein QOD77_95 [Thermoplasmata archaeon]|nr:hypothetical protein [Thermoplasmata archaeon]
MRPKTAKPYFFAVFLDVFFAAFFVVFFVVDFLAVFFAAFLVTMSAVTPCPLTRGASNKPS